MARGGIRAWALAGAGHRDRGSTKAAKTRDMESSPHVPGRVMMVVE